LVGEPCGRVSHVALQRSLNNPAVLQSGLRQNLLPLQKEEGVLNLLCLLERREQLGLERP
jgi:hypothetical protein